MPSFYGENPPDTEVGTTDATESQVSEDAVTETDTSGGFYQGSPEQTTTEAYEADARAARDAALAAQEAAEDAQTAAEASESSASSSEANAASSESAAATSATNASNSASAAAGSATTAATQASNASSSATAAAASASAAASSESAAASSETAAASSQTAAAGSAAAAASSAGTASTKASEAATSATNAAASESAAASSESAAATSATQAAASATNAASSETAAASSETAAASSESAASTSASNAASSASAASSSATAAASSATAAASSATSAGTARDDAQAALDSFDDRYLGAKSSEPTVDNDGDALVAGALFFDTVNTVMKVYDGSQWLAAYASVSGALLAINNLDDVTNTATARSNLGLGTASEQNVTYFATAAQGALADSALQNGDNVSVLTNDAGYLVSDSDGSDLQNVRAETIEVNVKNVSGGSLAKGTPVHQTGTSGAATFEVVAADASSASLMPAHFVLLETLADEAEGRGLLMGRISEVDTSSFSEGDTIYVAAGGGFTNVAPTGEGNLIQNLGTVTRVDATNGGGEVMGAGRSNATPNLNNGNIFIGNASNQAVSASLSTSVSNAGFASTTYVDTAVANLVDSAPATLDTLNELAAALGDDANFSTTVTNSIATKWTQDNTKISNWDTAYGWGNHASAGYLTGNQTITLTGDVSGSGTTSISVTIADDSHNHIISNVDGLQAALDGKLSTSGKAADSNLLDGIDSSQFLRSDADDTFTGNLTTGANNHITFGPNSSWSSSLRVGGNGRTATGTEMASVVTTDGNLHLDAADSNNGIYLNFYAGTAGVAFGNGASGSNAWVNTAGNMYRASIGNASNPYWHAANDGSGSGLDADLLDGYQLDGATSVATRIFNNKGQNHNTYTNFNTVMTPGPNYLQGSTNGPAAGQFYGFMFGLGSDYGTSTGASGHYASQMYYPRASQGGSPYLYFRDMESGSWGSWRKVYAGYADSAGNAGTLDGIDSSQFLRSDTSDTAAGKITFNTGIARGNHHVGHLEGSYNNVGANSDKTNPIYTIGSGYNPSLTSVAGMYGIGYAHPNLWGTGKSSGWGMYVVENGVIHTTLSIGGLWSKGSIFSDTQGTLWGTSNDGSGSGLDADTVDGIQGSVLLRSDTNNSVAYTSKTSWYSNTNGASTAGAQSSLEVYSPTTNADAFMTFHVSGDFAGYFGLDGTTNDLFWGGWSRGAAKYKIWHAANDGSGSGLDADLLDGSQGSYFDHRAYTSTGNYLGGHYVSGGSEKPNSSALGAGKLKPIMLSGSNVGVSGAWNDVLWMSTYNGGDVKRSTAIISSKYDATSVWVNKANYDSSSWGTSYLFWNSGNDGAGSGLDADLLDGLNSSQFLRSDTQATSSGSLILANNWGQGTYNGQFVIQGTYPSWETRGDASQPYGWLHHQDGSGRYTLYNIASYNQNNWTQRYIFNTNGNFTATGNVTAYSDISKKKDIRPLEDASGYLAALDAKRYRWKEDDREDIGFIAQDVEAVGLDAFVIENETHNPKTGEQIESVKSLDYGRMVSVLWQAVKELKSEVDDLKAQLEEVK